MSGHPEAVALEREALADEAIRIRRIINKHAEYMDGFDRGQYNFTRPVVVEMVRTALRAPPVPADDVDRVIKWVAHNGGLINDWGREWTPGKHPPLTEFIEGRLRAALAEQKKDK